MEYTIDHPDGVNWFPTENLRIIFGKILENGLQGRWKIETRYGFVVNDYVNGTYKAQPLGYSTRMEDMFVDLLRYDSQKYLFIYNILELSLYQDSTGNSKPGIIITCPVPI